MPAFERVVARSALARSLGGRPHLPRARRRAAARAARTGIASSTADGRRQPHRPHADGACARRPAAGALRVRELPERLRGRAERLPPDDLRGRARRAGDAARLRAPPRRLRLRGRRLPGGPARRAPLRPAPARRGPLPARREGPGLPRAATLADYRALYRAYLQDPDLQDARARWPFVAMWDNHEFSWLGWQSFQLFGDERPARADAQGGGEPGVVRVPAGARAQGGRRLARALRGARREGRADRALRRRTVSARSRTTSPRSAASPAIAACAGAATSS